MVKVQKVINTKELVEMYDISMIGTPVYCAGGLVVHNSGNQLAEALASKGIDTKQKSEKTGVMKLDKTALTSVGLEITDKLLLRKNLRTQLNTYIKKFTVVDQGKVRYKLFDTDCLTESAIVLTKNGYKSIKDVIIGDFLWTIKGWDKVVSHIPQGKDKVYKLTLNDGRELTGNYRHPVQVLNNGVLELKPLGGLSEGDILPMDILIPELFFNPVKINFNFDYSKLRKESKSKVQNNNPINIPEYLTLDLCKLMGAIAGDGSIKSDRVSLCFWNQDKDIIEAYTSIFKTIHNKDCGLEVGKDNIVRANWCSVILRDFYKWLEVKEDKVPEIIKQSGPAGILAFFSGYFDTDGSKRGNAYSITSICKNRLRELHHCLSLLGYKLNHANLKGKKASELRFILRTAVERFRNENFMSCERKKPTLSNLTKSRNILKVKSVIELSEELDVYDITMETEPLFIANGIVTHNTGRLASGNDMKVKSKANHYFLPLNFQNFTKPKVAYYECIKTGVTDKDIAGYEFIYITSDKDEFEVYRKSNPDKKYVEGFSPKMNIRNAIIPPENFLLSSVDFSGQELRILANASNSPIFIDAFLKGEDLHKNMAIAIWGKENYDKNKRTKAKEVNFGVAYGATPFTFIQRGYSKEEAEQLFDDYWKINTHLKAYQDNYIKGLYKNGGVAYSFYKRPRRLKAGLSSSYRPDRSGAERQGLNHAIQSTGADIIRQLLYKLYINIFKGNEDEIRFAGTIHDEVLYYIKKDKLAKWTPIIQENMEQRNLGKIPLIVEFEFGYSYGDRYTFDYVDGELVPRYI